MRNQFIGSSRVRIAAVAIAASLCALAPAIPFHTARAASASTTIVVAYYGEPSSIDPHISYDYAGPAMMHTLYEGLVREKGTSTTQIEGVLAQSWSSNAAKTV